MDAAYLIAPSRAGVFASFPNIIAEITGKLEDVEKAKDQGVFCLDQIWQCYDNCLHSCTNITATFGPIN